MASVVSRTIVEHHEGRIGVTAELGVGSTFYFEIHLQSYDLKEKLSVQDSGVELSDSHTHILDPNPLPHHPATTMPSSSSSSPNNLFQRVLIVDDSKLNRKMLYRQLKHNFVDIVEV